MVGKEAKTKKAYEATGPDGTTWHALPQDGAASNTWHLWLARDGGLTPRNLLRDQRRH
ncbi:hypothetical protein pqer_cds_118 [Pandoravirus quercus]|uniref:Uncharacterized protein n=1 Tax=Pandoravirus quercus TaxID=2107709 RepID=A0A2U7U7Z0_9VIRU|nr:hypothetical protein pqer_cds_118 [Pandoravirus quercus]AVK74540.1 hypothetical protein pqer_cds_118 [Pandoravirus quercus]